MKTMLIRFLRAMEKQGDAGTILIKSEKKLKLLESGKTPNVCLMQWKDGKIQFQIAPFVTDVWS